MKRGELPNLATVCEPLIFCGGELIARNFLAGRVYKTVVILIVACGRFAGRYLGKFDDPDAR